MVPASPLTLSCLLPCKQPLPVTQGLSLPRAPFLARTPPSAPPRPPAPGPLRTEVQKLLHGQRGRGELAEVLDVLGRPGQGRVLQQRAEPAHGGGTAARLRARVAARRALALGSARFGPARPSGSTTTSSPGPGRPPKPGQSARGGSPSPPMAAHKQLQDSQSPPAPARGFPPGPAPFPGLAGNGLLFSSGQAESPPPSAPSAGSPARTSPGQSG